MRNVPNPLDHKFTPGHHEPQAEPATRKKAHMPGELRALARIDEILSGLTRDEVDRTLSWIDAKHGARFVATPPVGDDGEPIAF